MLTTVLFVSSGSPWFISLIIKHNFSFPLHSCPKPLFSNICNWEVSLLNAPVEHDEAARVPVVPHFLLHSIKYL